jgi:truncated hemoglobin YjbI
MAPPDDEATKDGAGVPVAPLENDAEEEERALAADDEGSAKASLFERLGGTPAVRAVVEDFYGRCVADPDLERFFESSKLAALKYHQLEFLKVAFGSSLPPDLDVPAVILDKHRSLFALGLDASHFDKVCQHLAASLEAAGAAPGLVGEAAGVLAPLRAVFEAGREKYGPGSEEAGAGEHRHHAVLQSSAGDTDKRRETLSDRLGGVDALKAAVSGLYGRILADPELSPFFEEANMTALKLHQVEFLKVAFGQVPDDLDVAGLMTSKHARLFGMGLNETHFDRVAGHLVATLEELGVDPALVEEAVSIVGPLRGVFEEGARQHASFESGKE